MARIARKSDGRRIFTAEFKREHIGRVQRGELTLAELSRKLGIARSLLQRWKRVMPLEAAPAGAARGRLAPVAGLREARYLRELQLLIGKQAVELELLRGELDALRTGRRSPGAPGR
jgi:transposase-like protein